MEIETNICIKRKRYMRECYERDEIIDREKLSNREKKADKE